MFAKQKIKDIKLAINLLNTVKLIYNLKKAFLYIHFLQNYVL
jgi:hypothetical protein